MQKNKALIFDLDGTAIDSPKQKLPSDRLINAIRAVESTSFVCAATGRPWTFAKSVLQSMNLSDPCVISGGTQICDPSTGTILWQCDINKDDFKLIKAVLGEHPGYGLIVNDFSENDYFAGGMPSEQINSNQEIYFADYVFVPDDIAAVIAAKLNEIDGITCFMGTSQKPGHKDLHMTNSIATKEHAVAELLSRLNISRECTWGFGDGLNDFHLFNAVNHKIAMGNAVEELKNSADEVIAPVYEEGLAQYFERLVKI